MQTSTLNRDFQATLPSLGHEMRGLLVLALPIIGTTVLRMAMGFSDFIMLSFTGKETTAAISPSVIFIWSIQCLGMGAATSVQTFASQALGRGQPREGAAYAAQVFFVSALFFLVSVPVSLLVRPFWEWVGHEAAVREMEITYCGIMLWSMGFAVICYGMDGFFNGIKRPYVALVAISITLVIETFSNYVLIFGKLGFPALGIKGAAITTACGWALRASILTAVYFSGRYRREFGTTAAFKIDFAKIRSIFKIGGPTGVQWLLDIGSWFVFMALIMGAYGTATIAASNIGLQYMHLSFMPAIGVGTAVCTVVGNAIGERRPDLAVIRAQAGMILTTVYMGAIGLVLYFLRYPLMDLLSSDADVIRFGAGVLIWAAVFQVFDALGITYMNALRGAGDTTWPAIAVALHCWVIFVTGGYLMTRYAPSWGYHGPWMTCTVYIILLGLLLWRRWTGGAWRKIDLFKDRSATVASAPIEPSLGPLAEGAAPTLAVEEVRA